MAIEIEPGTTQQPGGREPGGPAAERAWWMRPAFHTAIVGAVIGYIFGHWLGNHMGAGYQQVSTADGNDLAIVLGYSFMVVGWLAGLGAFNDLLRQMAGRPVPEREEGESAASGLARYFRFTLDHKVRSEEHTSELQSLRH